MSLASYAIAVRNHLRTNLTNFYGDLTNDKNNNCRVMATEKALPNSGREFIAVIGSQHQPGEQRISLGVEEKFGLRVVVSLMCSDIPTDMRGEAAYTSDPDTFAGYWQSLEQRCREIIGLVDKNYAIMQAANGLFNADNGFTEPLLWVRSDPAPTECGPEHWYSIMGLDLPPEADKVFGLLMRVHFGEAVRIQPTSVFDIHT